MFDTVHESKVQYPSQGHVAKKIFLLSGLDTSGIIYEFEWEQFGLKVILRIHEKRCKRIGDRDYIDSNLRDFHLGNESNDL